MPYAAACPHCDHAHDLPEAAPPICVACPECGKAVIVRWAGGTRRETRGGLRGLATVLIAAAGAAVLVVGLTCL